MIDKIVLSTDRTTAIIYFTDRPNFTVYSDTGNVELLLLDLISPIGNNISSNYSSLSDYLTSIYSDTLEIDLNIIDKKAV